MRAGVGGEEEKEGLEEEEEATSFSIYFASYIMHFPWKYSHCGKS